MTDAKELYETHAELVEELLKEPQPTWEQLSFDEHDSWQMHADELNEKDKP